MPILTTRGAGSAKGFGFGGGAAFLICATGGTVTESGDYKIHTFTGPGTFSVSKIQPTSPGVVDYLVVAGGGAPGGSGACSTAGGSGAGGYRESKQPTAPWTASPLASATGITATVTSYPITVGGGGTGVPQCASGNGVNGSDSIFSTITSTGGGAAISDSSPESAGNPGGSGGGATTGPATISGGSGNTPPTSPPQGNKGGDARNATSYRSNAGGGGAGSAGPNQFISRTGSNGGPGGDGVGTQIAPASGVPGPSPSLKYFAGGGGGGSDNRLSPGVTGGVGGIGGGGNGAGDNQPVSNGGTNTGGGGGGGSAYSTQPLATGNGGSGIVVIRYKYK